jgi:putative hemolysin
VIRGDEVVEEFGKRGHAGIITPLVDPPAAMPPTALVLRRSFVVALLAAATLVGATAHAQTAAPSPAPDTTTLANPASANCISKGGKLTMEKNGKGDELGVCTFGDNRQCEEWALMRGECRPGGIRVTGFVTPAARYCAISGGTYRVRSGSNTPNEQGTCTFKGNKLCDAAAFYNGNCTRQGTRPVSAEKAIPTIQATFRCAGGKSIDANFINLPSSSVKLVLSDGRALDLPQTISGSGARYANANESIVFWNKGNTAFIEEGGKTTFANCRT